MNRHIGENFSIENQNRKVDKGKGKETDAVEHAAGEKPYRNRLKIVCPKIED